MGRRHWFRAFASRLLDLTLPRSCIACSAALADDLPLCAICRSALGAPPPVMRIDAGGKAALRVSSLLRHAGAGRELVHALKYQGRTDVAGFLARRAASMRAIRPDTALVPVPLHSRRERARGYNQSELLARALAETAPGVVVAMALVRERPTRSQTRLDREARAANVARAFALADPSGVRGRDVLLIDDVVTTGATLSAAALALRPAEPATVAAVVAAAEM